MFKAYLKDLFTTFLTIVPIVILVFIFWGFNLITLSENEIILFSIGSVFLTFGSSLFTHFAEISMKEIGTTIGNSLAKSKSLKFIILIAFLLGFIFTIAEPDLKILADQTPLDTYVFIIIVSIGVGVMFIIGTLRILLNLDLRIILILFYGITFALCLLIINYNESLPIIFDSGGSVTGSISVPLILAIGMGLSSRHSKNKENSIFGLSGIISIGPLLIMAIMFIISPSNTAEVETTINTSSCGTIIINFVTSATIDSLIALCPILVFYIIYSKFVLKLSWKKILNTIAGFGLILIGLILFLAGANIGFLTIGRTIGASFAANNENGVLIMCIFVTLIGLIIAFAEPSIKILSNDIEQISEGSIKKSKILISLSIAIAFAILISFIRIIYDFNLVYILVPGYILIFILTFLVDKKYVGIAFDSGAVSSGTLTAAFILPIAIGFAEVSFSGNNDKIVSSSFGILALVAMVPILTIEIIGIQAKAKQKLSYRRARKRIRSENENQIIHFNKKEEK